MIKIGKYEVLDKLGAGATAEVYRATDTVLGREVALKVLKPALVADASAFQRFVQEARTAAGLFHPNIATILDMGEAEGRYYIAMRYYPGQSLDRILNDKGPLSMEEALGMVTQIGAALDFAHQRGFLHRDIKPSNILCTPQGEYILTDFGLMRAMMSVGLTTHTGAVLGTPAYIAPEIWLGKPAAAQTDVYALACVFYEMITGEALFGGESPPVIMTRHMLNGPQFPEVWPVGAPAGMADVLQRALDREPEKRYASAGAFCQALENLSKAPLAEATEAAPAPDRPLPDALPPVPARPPDEPVEAEKERSARWILSLFGSVVVGVVVFFAVMVNKERRSTAADLLRQGTQIFETQQSFYATTTAASLSNFPKVIVEKKGVKMALVPTGEFQMGGKNGDDNEKPVHTVYLDAFYIDIYEVTNAMYAQCVQAGVCTRPTSSNSNTRPSYFDNPAYADYPVISVSWEQANKYCAWRGGRLPSEAEWEKAARGGLEGKRYPWGDEPPSCTTGVINGANFLDCEWEDTIAVGSFAANGYGLFDMAGNVWEWVSDWYARDYYRTSPSSSPLGPNSGSYRVFRGGGWGSSGGLRTAYRNSTYPSSHYLTVGFRCAAPPGK